jgi:hypothetical protein
MLRIASHRVLLFTVAACVAWPAHGVPVMLPDAGPALLCRGAIAATESATRIPDAFLSAIGRVESGRALPNGLTAPWPWTVNAAGEGHFYESKAEAVAAVRQFQANGIRSLDVGCLQVNIMYHPDAFASPEQAFDPATNVAYAARMLMSLHAQLGSWPKAAAAYHSQTPALGQAYQEKVLAAWAEPDQGVVPAAKVTVQRPEMAKPPPPGPAAIAALPAVPMSVSYTHTTRLPAAPGGIGRSLAAYRTMPVQMASRAPLQVSAQY